MSGGEFTTAPGKANKATTSYDQTRQASTRERTRNATDAGVNGAGVAVNSYKVHCEKLAEGVCLKASG